MMVRKKVEGNEEQRRAAAHQARRDGEAPSARKETTGASKQPGHLPRSGSVTHEEKVSGPYRGKQEWRSAEEAEVDVGGPIPVPSRDFEGRARTGYTEAHERVFQALVQAEQEHGGEGVTLDETARHADLPKDQTRELLHDLTQTHRLVTELAGADTPDLGPRYETKPRL